MTGRVQRDLFLSPTRREMATVDELRDLRAAVHNERLRADNERRDRLDAQATVAELEATVSRLRQQNEVLAAQWMKAPTDNGAVVAELQAELRTITRNKARADRYSAELTAENARLLGQVEQLTGALAQARSGAAAAAPARPAMRPAEGDPVSLEGPATVASDDGAGDGPAMGVYPDRKFEMLEM